MSDFFHSVTLDKDACKGCTSCIKSCPTSAIRVRGGKAKIINERCIDCGECIRVCPYHAKKAITESLSEIKKYKYTIAMPAPSIYGQFPKAKSIDQILEGIVNLGFNDVFEVAKGAERVAAATKRLLNSGQLETPVISSACPAIVRLIAIRFPNLINNIVPLLTPMDVSAQMARQKAMQETGLESGEIGIFFISPCAAKATAIKRTLGIDKSNVDAVISLKDIYKDLSAEIWKVKTPKKRGLAGFKGVGWALSEGECHAMESANFIAVDGIADSIKILEQIDNGKLSNIDFVELSSCTGGCVGGSLTIENPFIAKNKISSLIKDIKGETLPEMTDNDIDDIMLNTPILHRSVMNLDDNIVVAMHKIEQLEKIYEKLPQIDCGACGAPDCKAHAEDIVRGFASEVDCIFKLREKVRALAAEMVELEGHMPPSIDNGKNEQIKQ